MTCIIFAPKTRFKKRRIGQAASASRMPLCRTGCKGHLSFVYYLSIGKLPIRLNVEQHGQEAAPFGVILVQSESIFFHKLAELYNEITQ